ncbi:MAG TPA: PEGA domain-containing protein [Kofleriaceae bacterium]|nr:PEGA domain-containing protein [Kofleriaceae bacterium]
MRVLALLALLCATARADSVGVVVTGERGPAEALHARIEKWVKASGRELVAAALSADAKSTFANCFVIEDVRKCAAGVVNARSKTDSVVYARVDGQAVVITWFVKKHAPASGDCKPCGDVELDAVLAKLSTQAALETGLVRVHSKPDGLDATIDGSPAGKTTVERDLPVGEHAISLLEQGREVAAKTIAVESNQEIDITLQARSIERAERKWPMYAVGAGAAVFVTGLVLFAASPSPTGERPTYTNTKPAGVTFMVLGAVVGGGGAAVEWGGVF